MRIVYSWQLTKEELEGLLRRPSLGEGEGSPQEIVRQIVDDVRRRGDCGHRAAKRLDGAELAPETLFVSQVGLGQGSMMSWPRLAMARRTSRPSIGSSFPLLVQTGPMEPSWASGMCPCSGSAFMFREGPRLYSPASHGGRAG